MAKMPFTLLIDPCPFTYADHARAVTGASMAAAAVMKERYGDKCAIDMDALRAGALLHDVGKLLEYAEKDGKYVKSRNGKFLRHPSPGRLGAAACPRCST
jgi:putative nucleotidyltransferase with HDIG domain